MFRNLGRRLRLTLTFQRTESPALNLNLFHRCNSTHLASTQLKSRSVVRVSGPETIPFLQGLVTNDLSHLETNPALYTLFLNSAGRVFLDSIVYKEVNKQGDSNQNDVSLLLESDATLQSTLVKHLKLYRVRRKVVIEEAELSPWVVFNTAFKDSTFPRVHSSKRQDLVLDSEIQGIGDPRLEELGWRVLLGPTDQIRSTGNESLEIVTESDYKAFIYALGVGEGIVDFPAGSSFPLESNGDYLHGISFQKGCYIGQELTARTHHTGVVRKRLMPFRLPEDFQLHADIVPSSLQLLNPAGKSVGKVRNIVKSYGLALTRIEEALSAPEVKLGDLCPVTLHKPLWWPTEASKEPHGHITVRSNQRSVQASA